MRLRIFICDRGFSFTDYYINELRRSVVDMLGEFRTEDAPVAYAIVNDMDEAKRAFYRCVIECMSTRS